jgi:hypothetical protein
MNGHLQAAISARAFEHRYRCERDPWHFETSPCEKDRYR